MFFIVALASRTLPIRVSAGPRSTSLGPLPPCLNVPSRNMLHPPEVGALSVALATTLGVDFATEQMRGSVFTSGSAMALLPLSQYAVSSRRCADRPPHQQYARSC